MIRGEGFDMVLPGPARRVPKTYEFVLAYLTAAKTLLPPRPVTN